MPSTELSATITRELHRIEEDCTHSGKSHFNAASRWGQWHLRIGIPAVAFSAIASTAFFTSWELLAGVLSASVAVLAALQTFLKPSELASSHKSAGDQYLALRNDARVLREVKLATIPDDAAAAAALESISTRRNELNLSSPQVSRGDFDKARKGIDAGEAQHRIDRQVDPQ